MRAPLHTSSAESLEESFRRMLRPPERRIPSDEVVSAQLKANPGNLGDLSPVVPAYMRGRMNTGPCFLGPEWTERRLLAATTPSAELRDPTAS